MADGLDNPYGPGCLVGAIALGFIGYWLFPVVPLLGWIAICLLLLFAFITLEVVMSRKTLHAAPSSPVVSSKDDALVGKEVVAVEALNPEGMVRLHSELWRARTRTGEPAHEGDRLRVCSREGLCLIVEPMPAEKSC